MAEDVFDSDSSTNSKAIVDNGNEDEAIDWALENKDGDNVNTYYMKEDIKTMKEWLHAII